MNTIDSNKPNISFGIAFKTYKTPNGNYTNEMLSIKEELALYKRLDRKLKRDKFVKTEFGLKTQNTVLEKDNYTPNSLAMRYTTKKESFFMDHNKINLQGVGDAFHKVRNALENLMNK